MSNVPKGKRGTNTMEVWQEAVKLAKYTMEITSNKKNFPARYDTMTSQISETAINIARYLWKDNEVNVRAGAPVENVTARLHMQDMAITEIESLLFLIDLAGKALHRPKKKTTYWAGMAIKTKQLAVAWHESDRKRLAKG